MTLQLAIKVNPLFNVGRLRCHLLYPVAGILATRRKNRRFKRL